MGIWQQMKPPDFYVATGPSGTVRVSELAVRTVVTP